MLRPPRFSATCSCFAIALCLACAEQTQARTRATSPPAKAGGASAAHAAGEAPSVAGEQAPESGAPAVRGGSCALRFEDISEPSGLAAFHHEGGNPEKRFILESMGAGVAWIDWDQDGDLDAYLTNGDSFERPAERAAPRDALWENDGGAHFRDASERLGLGDERWTMGVAVADIEGDGWPDLYVTNWGPNALYRNRGGQRFEECAEAAGLADPRWSTGACFFDADRDGDLDLYVSNYVRFDPEEVRRRFSSMEYKGAKVYFGPHGMQPDPDAFYRNDGAGHFDDDTAAAGIRDSTGYGFEALAFDADDDGWTDVFVANDSVANFLWRNRGDGRFEERAYSLGLAYSRNGSPQASMGAALGDGEGDGRLDLVTSTFTEDYSTYFRAQPRGHFADVSGRIGLAQPTMNDLGWGVGFEDFDLDGDLDLLQVNGHVFPQVDRFPFGFHYLQALRLLENDASGQFRDVGAAAGAALATRSAGRGLAIGDCDGDGDADVLVGVLDGSPRLLRNDSARAGGWIGLLPRGLGAARDPFGARVTLEAGGRQQLAAWCPNQGFLSARDPRLYFGLPRAAGSIEARVRWPDGGRERFGELEPGRVHTLVRGSGVLLDPAVPERDPLRAR